ncbi:MAG: helix-turn-helix domain-containing protein [Lachnospiraceae bacterium]|nr:helix-turn-helix domain-containing protein [Lachnospiraceae bacterium]
MTEKKFAISESLCATDIKNIRKKLNLSQTEFAELVNVSKKTIERWESSVSDKEITGPIVTLVKLLNEYPQSSDDLKIPPKTYAMRLWYMCNEDICTIIDVDEPSRKVRIFNYTKHYMLRAFGREEKPTFEQYEEFLESRCFPRTRDKMKLILKELDLPFYEPLMIIEKTQGRMAEDNFWIRIER